MLPRQIEQRGSVIHQCPGCSQGLTRRAVINVARRVISKVAAREGAVVPRRLVEHRNMWRDALLLDQPVKHRSCNVICITDKPLRHKTEALLCSLDNCLLRCDICLQYARG